MSNDGQTSLLGEGCLCGPGNYTLGVGGSCQCGPHNYMGGLGLFQCGPHKTPQLLRSYFGNSAKLCFNCMGGCSECGTENYTGKELCQFISENYTVEGVK